MESGWVNLPKDLLDSILERLILSSSDYVRFSVVCKPWFGAAKDNQSRHAKKLLSHPEPPMLLFFNGKEDAWNLYNVVENKVLDVKLRLPNKRFCGFSKGWLVVVEKDFTVTLINPFSMPKGMGERENLAIYLPQLNPPPDYSREELEEVWAEDCEYFVLKAIITADPILNTSDCIVVIIFLEQCEVAFIRPSKDTSWTYIDNKYRRIMDVLQCKEEDKFYVIKGRGELLTLNIDSESDSNVNSVAPGIDEIFLSRAYLVDSNGQDLLMIHRHCWEDCEQEKDGFATKLKVFKFNLDTCRWVEENTLGDDVAIFIGENLSISVAVSNFPGCKRNCIYYNHDFDFMEMNNKLHDFGVYDMEKKTISKPYSKDVMTLLEMVNQRPIWFTPTFQAR